MTTPDTLELRIGRIVWHGSDAPDAAALAAAVQHALARTMQGRAVARATRLQRAADAIAQQVLLRCPGAAG